MVYTKIYLHEMLKIKFEKLVWNKKHIYNLDNQNRTQFSDSIYFDFRPQRKLGIICKISKYTLEDYIQSKMNQRKW